MLQFDAKLFSYIDGALHADRLRGRHGSDTLGWRHGLRSASSSSGCNDRPELLADAHERLNLERALTHRIRDK